MGALTLVAAMLIAAGPEREPYRFVPEPVTQPRFAPVTVPTQHTIVRDGVDLVADVYMPDTSAEPDWKQPVIVVFGPYKDVGAGLPYSPVDDLAPRYTTRGFTVVEAAMRGTSGSGGCWNSFGPDDAADLAAIVRHFAAEPWSGKVGAFGASAEGSTINAALTLRQDSDRMPLATAVVISANSGYYDSYAFDGVPYDWAPSAPTQYELYALNSTVGVSGPVTERVGCESYAASADHLSGTRTGFTGAREYRDHVGKVDASMLYVAMLRDRVVLPIALDGWYDEISTFKRAVLYSAPHAPPWMLPNDRLREDWWAMVDAWFDAELLGLDIDMRSWPPVQVQDEHNVWRAVNSVDDMGQATSWFPTVDGTLTTAPGDGRATFTETGPGLVWTGPALTEALHLSGQPRLSVPITLDKPDANFTWRVQEVTATGMVRTLVKGHLSAEHRHSVEEPIPVDNGVEHTYNLRAHYFDAWLSEGSRLRITLAGHDTPEASEVQVTGLAALTSFTATVDLGRSVISLPVANDNCGLTVAQADPPQAPVPPCPRKVFAKW